MDTEQIIAKLGGTDAMVQLTGASPNAIRQWPRIGIPYKYFALLVAEARRLGVRGISVERLHHAKAVSLRRGIGRERAA